MSFWLTWKLTQCQYVEAFPICCNDWHNAQLLDTPISLHDILQYVYNTCSLFNADVKTQFFGCKTSVLARQYKWYKKYHKASPWILKSLPISKWNMVNTSKVFQTCKQFLINHTNRWITWLVWFRFPAIGMAIKFLLASPQTILTLYYMDGNDSYVDMSN